MNVCQYGNGLYENICLRNNLALVLAWCKLEVHLHIRVGEASKLTWWMLPVVPPKVGSRNDNKKGCYEKCSQLRPQLHQERWCLRYGEHTLGHYEYLGISGWTWQWLENGDAKKSLSFEPVALQPLGAFRSLFEAMGDVLKGIRQHNVELALMA